MIRFLKRSENCCMDKTLQELAALKTATIHFDAIHEYQIYQLKNYPVLISGAAQPWSVEVNHEQRKVIYNLLGRKTKKSEADMKYIKNIIRTYLLWDDTEVIFNWKNK